MRGIANALWRISSATAFSIAACMLAATTVLAAPFFGSWTVSEFQPNIRQGGRANTIAVNPSNSNEILVASETGGLFRSTDHGHTWRHVDTLAEYSTSAVAFLLADPNVVVATTTDDFRVASGGGIWRSTDGGLNWAQSVSPPAPPGLTDRLSAGEISIAPDTGNIYIATSFGVAMSSDQGATWTNLDVFGSPNHGVSSVLAQSGNRVLAGSGLGVRRSLDGGISWSWASSAPGAIGDMHAFGRSPFNDDQAYVVNGSTQLFVSEDAGDHWIQIASAPAGGGVCGGIAFVKPIGRVVISKYPRRIRRWVDLYYGNRCDVAKLPSPAIAATTRFDYSGSWVALGTDHRDTRDLAFESSRRPLLLATDGGLHQTTNGGLNWTFVGGGTAGYNALQITEIKGQWIDDAGRHDLYFGTQDNSLWSSSDNGVTWNLGDCCEGFFIEGERSVGTSADSKITFVACADCVNKISGALFAGISNWQNPPDYVGDSNPKTVNLNLHVQGMHNFGSFTAGLVGTTDLGSSWQQFAAFPESRRDLPKLSRTRRTSLAVRSLPVLYQSIQTSWDASKRIEIDHLVRMVKRRSSNDAIVSYPAMNNFGGLGINPTMFAWYQVFAVNPRNRSHLIAADVINEKVMQSLDGGDNWSEVPGLTTLVTDGGRLLFDNATFSILSQASAIAFSPDNPDVIAVGTWQAGILISSDSGANWSKVPGSEKVTYITGFDWRNAHDLIVSSYGRGLWRVNWRIRILVSDYEHYCKFCEILRFRVPIPDPPPEPWRRAVVVFGGHVQGAVVVDGRLRELFVSPGSSTALVSDREEYPLKVTETTRRVGFRGIPGARFRKGVHAMVGLTLDEEGKVLGAVLSPHPLSFTQPEDDRATRDEEEGIGSATSPTLGKPYVELSARGINASIGFPAGARIRVNARNMPIGSSVEVAIDDRAVEKVVVGPDGKFEITVVAPREEGLHRLTILDSAGAQVLTGTMFLVRHRDEDRREERERTSVKPAAARR